MVAKKYKKKSKIDIINTGIAYLSIKWKPSVRILSKDLKAIFWAFTLASFTHFSYWAYSAFEAYDFFDSSFFTWLTWISDFLSKYSEYILS